MSWAALNGESRELHEEIERLSKKYGVRTPYTSFIAADDGSLKNELQIKRFQMLTRQRYLSTRGLCAHREIEARKSARYKRQDADTKICWA